MFKNGKTALVTGASSGIGADVAIGLGTQGVSVIAHYNSNLEGANRVAEQIKNAGGTASLMYADLGCSAGIHDLSSHIKSLGCPIDILINNAGSLIRRAKVLDLSEELWDSVMTLNLKSSFMVSQVVLQAMKKQSSGCIVNVSSVAAIMGGGIGAAAYAAAKGGLNTLTKAMAREFGPDGIRVNAISPGTIDTNYHRKFSTQEALDSVVAATPVGRLGTTQDAADVILFLCSDAARFIQGQVIEVNGGYCMV